MAFRGADEMCVYEFAPDSTVDLLQIHLILKAHIISNTEDGRAFSPLRILRWKALASCLPLRLHQCSKRTLLVFEGVPPQCA